MNLDEARSVLNDHSRSKRNGVFPEFFSHSAKLTNPLCGDHVELKIQIENEKILEIGFKAVACAICSASTSLISTQVKGQCVDEVLKLGHLFETSVLENESKTWPLELAQYKCFEHLRVNPSRRICALLPWVALRKAFKESTIGTNHGLH